MTKQLERLGFICLWTLAATGLSVQALADCEVPNQQAELTLGSVTVNNEPLVDLDAYAGVARYSLESGYESVGLHADDYSEYFQLGGQP